MSEERLIKSANYVRTELPVRIAHRIRDLQALPYVVVMQEGVTKVYEVSYIPW
jgi:pyruvate dehydrogenase kinase 2/3/4